MKITEPIILVPITDPDQPTANCDSAHLQRRKRGWGATRHRHFATNHPAPLDLVNSPAITANPCTEEPARRAPDWATVDV